jgi:hypothetical protein
MPLTTLPLTSNNPFHPLKGVEKHLPCGDISHHQPLFFPTICHHPNKVLVANLDEGMGTLFHEGSTRNPAFGLWPLKQEVVLAVRRDLEALQEDGGGVEVVQKGEVKEEEEQQATSLSAFLGEGNDDAEWEIVESPKTVKEKFVLVGKRFVGDVDMLTMEQPEWVRST